MSDLPPEWYSRAERWVVNNKVLIFAAIFFLFFFVWPFMQDSEPLDYRLLEGIDDE